MRYIMRKYFSILISLFLISLILSCAKQDENKLTEEQQSAPPSSHVKTFVVAVGSSQCAYGGVQIEMGIDDNMNGALDASEVDKTDYVCNGSPGAAGDNATALNSLMSTEVESSGSNCTNGGKKINYGIDDNSDGTLASSEVDGSTYVCDGLTLIDIGFSWKGTLSTAPSDPSSGWAYYNSTDNKSYIYANASWNILAQDGTGATGATGETGATGATSRIQYTVYCNAALEGTSLKYTYDVKQWNNGDLFIYGSIYGSSYEISATTMYSEIQTGWTTAPVFLTYDASGSANWGYWKISGNRTTGVVTILYTDSDVSGGSTTWVQDSSECTLNTVF